MAAERIARARRRARVKRVKHMEDVVALERDAGRPGRLNWRCAAVEQVLQRCIGADEVRGCRRRQRSRVLPGSSMRWVNAQAPRYVAVSPRRLAM